MTVWKPDHGGPRPAHERSEANLWPRVSAHKPRIRTLTPLPPARAEVSGTSYFRALETADFEQAEGGHRSTKYMFKTVTESSGTAPVDVKGEASKTVFELTAERIDANEEGLISTVSDIDDQFDHDEDIDDWSVDLDDSAQDESAPEEAQGSLAARRPHKHTHVELQ